MPRGGARFSSSELVTVLSHYDIGIIKKVKPLYAGNTRAPKVIITSKDGKFLLKRRPKAKDNLNRAKGSHKIQMFLADNGFPVSRVINIIDGRSSILSLENHIYEMFEFVEGSRYNGSGEATIDTGRQLANFHKLLIGYSSSFKPPKGSFHDSANVRKHLKFLTHDKKSLLSGQLRHIAEDLETLYNACSVNANHLGFDSWHQQMIHGDWHPGNMLFADDKIIAVLDFDSIKIAQPATDLANGMLQFSLVAAGRPNPADWPAYLDESKVVQFFKGYKEVIAPDENVLDSVFDLMIETIIAEAVLPIAATGQFGHSTGLGFLKMILRKAEWIYQNKDSLKSAISQ